MRLIVEIEDKNIADKIVWLLKSFQNMGVRIKSVEDESCNEPLTEQNWREIGMSTHSADRDDDKFLYEAAWEFYNEKHSY